jgi:membrane protease YdiL (CAAX protease family)
LSYAERGKTAWWRYPVAFVLALLITIALAAAAVVPLMLLHLTPPDLKDRLTHVRNPTIFFVAVGLQFAVVLIGFVLAIRWLHGKRFGDILGAWRWRGFASGAAIWAAMLIGLTLIDLALAPKGFSFTATDQTPALILWALPALALQTFAEEFVFRGYVTQGLLLATRRPVVAALISGLLFGLVHIPNGLPQALNAGIFGVVLALIAIRTGGLAFTTGLHLVNNLFGAVVVVSKADVFGGAPGLFTQDTPQLIWSDLALAVAATMLVGWLVWRRSSPAPSGAEA